MRAYGTAVLTGLFFWSGAAAQTPAQTAPEGSAPVFRTETRLVPVDVVVQDKKGNYVHDLERKDFKVWEDNKEQSVRNFSFEADPASPLAQQKKYLVLFFDLSSMNSGDQIQARQAAAKFIDANAGPNRLMAVVNFSGMLQIAQNFTDDIERLKQVVTAVKMGMVVSNTGIGGPSGGGGPRLGGGAQFGQRTMMLALRSLAANMAEVPGRKTLVLFSSGFPMTPVNSSEIMSEITAAIDSCNRANVAVYPVDVRGLVGNTMPFGPGRGAVTLPGAARNAGLALAAFPVLRIAAWMAAYDPQRGGAGGGASGGSSSGGSSSGSSGASGSSGSSGGGGTKSGGGGNFGGSSGGSSGSSGSSGGARGAGGTGASAGGGSRTGSGTTSGGGGGGNTPNTNRMNRTLDPNNTRGIMGRFPETATTNQQVLYMLADGTGGFVIVNTNDLLGGLEKINREQNEYYLLAYAPPESAEGSCHTIKVKVSRGGLNVRARSGYCNARQADLLAGTPVEKQMETAAQGGQAGTIAAAPMQTPFFFTAPNTAAVHVVMEIPTKQIKFEKVKGKEHAEINVMGIAYRPDGNVAAKFSDAVKLDLENKKAVEEFASKPLHYENQFEIGSGDYTLKVVFTSAGAGFGKLETPLKIETYESQQFAVSALAMATQIRPLNAENNINSDLVEGKTPLVVTLPNGSFQLIPAGATRFRAAEQVVIYFEVYEPLLQPQDANAAPVVMHAQMRILDRAGAEKMDSGGMDIAGFVKVGQPVVPVALKIPANSLTPGQYKMEIKAVDSAGRGFTRTEEFEIIG